MDVIRWWASSAPESVALALVYLVFTRVLIITWIGLPALSACNETTIGPTLLCTSFLFAHLFKFFLNKERYFLYFSRVSFSLFLFGDSFRIPQLDLQRLEQIQMVILYISIQNV